MTARPFVKFPGGKRRLAPRILELMPKEIRVYREPFVGGGAVFFALAASGEHKYTDAILSDVNVELMTTYEGIRDDQDGLLVSTLEMLAKLSSEEFFYKMRHGLDEIRRLLPDASDGILVAARMIYLNKTCFNGLYRVNGDGQFNVPWGKYKNPTICDRENIEACSNVLEYVDLVVQSFEEAVEGARPGDVIYFDPPYVELSKTSSFTAYTPGGFNVVDQVRLANTFRELAASGIHMVLSNADTPLARELYRGFEVHLIGAARSINSEGSGRGEVGELLVVSRGKA